MVHTMKNILLMIPLGIACLSTLGFSQTDSARLDGASWENVSDEFFKTLDVHAMEPAYVRRCVGMAVVPTGEVFVLTSKNHGVCVSKDRGVTWTVVPGNQVTGRCETGFGFSIAYPYDGRLAFFTIDGDGGITLDGGKTWRPFTKMLRMFEFADVDWSVKNPQTIFGLLHEPFYTVLSTDGGGSWRQLYKDAETPDQDWTRGYHLGVIDSKTLVRSHRSRDAIATSTDDRKTWTDAAPVFLPPDGPMKGFNADGSFNYFGWDAKGGTLYASSLGGSVYRLKLQP